MPEVMPWDPCGCASRCPWSSLAILRVLSAMLTFVTGVREVDWRRSAHCGLGRGAWQFSLRDSWPDEFSSAGGLRVAPLLAASLASTIVAVITARLSGIVEDDHDVRAFNREASLS